VDDATRACERKLGQVKIDSNPYGPWDGSERAPDRFRLVRDERATVATAAEPIRLSYNLRYMPQTARRRHIARRSHVHD
jgi:hypothetical protein